MDRIVHGWQINDLIINYVLIRPTFRLKWFHKIDIAFRDVD